MKRFFSEIYNKGKKRFFPSKLDKVREECKDLRTTLGIIGKPNLSEITLDDHIMIVLLSSGISEIHYIPSVKNDFIIQGANSYSFLVAGTWYTIEEKPIWHGCYFIGDTYDVITNDGKNVFSSRKISTHYGKILFKMIEGLS